MPSFAIPPKEPRTIIIDTLERTSAESSVSAFRGEAAKLRRSGQISQYLWRRIKMDRWIDALPALCQIGEGWNSYASPPPNGDSASRAADILKRLNPTNLIPDAIRASAEGGIAIVFTSGRRNRAVIEALNNGEQFLLMYDLDGRNQTLDWPSNLDEQGKILGVLSQYLERHTDAVGNS